MTQTKDSLVIDTHALLWFLQGDSVRLSPQVRDIMTTGRMNLILPATALAEACWIVEHKKTSIPSTQELLKAVDQESNLRFVPLDRHIIELSNTLTAIDEMHDRQIVATTLLVIERGVKAFLATTDRMIIESKLVPVIW